MATYFVSETYIKENTPLSQNIDPKDILPHIPAAQDLYTQDLLGTNFYSHLWVAYSGQTLTSSEEDLVAKIKPALAYRAAEMAIPFLQFQVKNKGPQIQSGDFSSSIAPEDARYIRHELKNRAEFYEERVRTYLCASGSSFSQYVNNNSTDMHPDTTTNYDCDLVLLNGRNCGHTGMCGCKGYYGFH